MNCNHVLGLIDAGPFADFPREHLDAAWAHAHQCPACGPALAAVTTLADDLRAMPEPVTPPDLAGVVMARIARIDEARTATVVARTRDWSGVATVLGGVAAGVAILATTPLGPDAMAALAAPRLGGIDALTSMPATMPAALAIGAGLLCYAAGLFGAIRSR